MNTLFDVGYVDNDDSPAYARSCRKQVAAVLKILCCENAACAVIAQLQGYAQEGQPPDSTTGTMDYNGHCGGVGERGCTS